MWALGCLGTLVETSIAGNGDAGGFRGDIQEALVLIRRNELRSARVKPCGTKRVLFHSAAMRKGMGPTSIELLAKDRTEEFDPGSD